MQKILAYIMLFNVAYASDHCFICKEVIQLDPQIIKQKIDQTIINKTAVINNLILPPTLAPLIVETPPPSPLPLAMRPFSFQNNMAPYRAPQLEVPSPFTGAIPGPNLQPIIANSLVIRSSVTTAESAAKVEIKNETKRHYFFNNNRHHSSHH